MVVNSINFWLFFASILIPFFVFLKKSWRGQNAWLLFASYFFYGLADWKMVPLLAIVTIVFYFLGLKIKEYNIKKPKLASNLTTCGVVLGVGILVYFKYLGFLVQEFANLFDSFGLKTNLDTFCIIMPIGISFFTFKLISYIIEVHRENIEPTKDIILFSTYISFFPTILSGPIDRPNDFIPQLKTCHTFRVDNISEGFRRILWGLFTKCCIADTFSFYTNSVFDNIESHNTTTILIAAGLFTIQLYADFSGYSNMAIGVALIMGYKVRENFNRPFFSKNLPELWRRWHMSLTSWITDYIFMPLNIAFRKWGKWGLYLATFLNLFFISIWHGANWTFVLFGIYNALVLIICMEIEKKRKKFEKRHQLKNNNVYQLSRTLITLLIWIFAGVLFRSNTVTDIITIISSFGDFGRPFQAREGSTIFLLFGLLSTFILIFKEYNDEHNKKVHFLHSSNTLKSIITAIALITYILLLGELEGGDFIYFRF